MGKQDQQPGRWRQRLPRLALIAAIVVVLGGFAASHFLTQSRSLTLSELDQRVKSGQVTEAEFDRDGHAVVVKLRNDDVAHTVDYPAGAEGKLYEELKAAGVPLKKEGTSFLQVLGTIGSIAIWVILGLFFFSMLSSVQQLVKKNEVDAAGEIERPDKRFNDVQGIDEIVERVREYVEMVKNPERYHKLGARAPKGAIFYGPPGTGKTLLAEALAGEAEVPFYRVSAASLMDMWLGSSAKRIKKLYANARRHQPAIVFIDEIDAIGGDRDARASSGADGERNAALTQLLNELDGFGRSKVFTIVATNRIDILDEALTRAGRFDLQLYVPPPDVNGREAILKVHTRNKPLGDDVDLRVIAKQTTGAVGADLEALANEAALTAARTGAEKVHAEHFAEALATMENGPARKGVKVNEVERRITAYHEAGHTLAAMFQERMDNPMRVTIVPRGQSGGHTRVASEEDRLFVSQQTAKARLVWMMAGRAGEKIACGADDFTSGASNDLQQATNLALHMVCQWGMGTYNTSIPLESWRQSPHAAEVERQVETLLDEAEQAAIDLLLQHQTALEQMVQRLLQEETIHEAALLSFANIPPLEGRPLEEVRDRHRKVIESVRTHANGVRLSVTV